MTTLKRGEINNYMVDEKLFKKYCLLCEYRDTSYMLMCRGYIYSRFCKKRDILTNIEHQELLEQYTQKSEEER